MAVASLAFLPMSNVRAQKMTRPVDSGIPPNLPPRPRKSLRVAITAEVTLRRSARSGYRVKIIDVSVHGCRAEFVDRPKLDELVWIKFDDLQSIGATVCWVRGFEVGLEFERPIHPAVLEMIVQRLRT